MTAGAVARRLGVAVTTLRTWDRRYGLGPSDHAPGQHRRYTKEDVARLELMRWFTFQGAPPADAAKAALAANPGDLPPGSAARQGGGRVIPVGRSANGAARGLARAASGLDGDSCGAIVHKSLAEHGVVFTWDQVLVPVLVGVGHRWEGDRRWVAVEHLLSWHISGELRAVPYGGPAKPIPRGSARDGGAVPRPAVLLATVDEEQHTLPLEALAAALREQRANCRILGARVPPRALLDAVARTGPALVVLWSQTEATAELSVLQELTKSPSPRVAAAGPGWNSMRLPGSVIRPVTLAAAIELAMSISPPRAARLPAPARPR